MKPWAPEVADSPYAPGDRSPEAQAWRREAIRAEATRRRSEGTFGAFSDDEMARARSVLGHAHDPVAEILGIEPELPVAVLTLGDLDFAPLVEAFQAAMERIADLFANLAPLVREINEIATKPDLNRHRHGRAAWCSKHGETRGGTCFRCAR